MMQVDPMTISNRTLIDSDVLGHYLEREWLLTNSRGSYAGGTLLGCNTRRYHGLLIASLLPPVERIVALSNVLEAVTIEGQRYELANFEFSDRLHPHGYRYLREVIIDTGVHFRYELPGMEVVKSIYLDYEQDRLVLNYDFRGNAQQVSFSLMPLVALRDFHGMQSSSTMLDVHENDGVVTAKVLDPQGPAIHMHSPQASFERGSDWWYAFHYRQEARRGQHDYEDVWAPGSFQCTLAAPEQVTFIFQVTRGIERPGPLDLQPHMLAEHLQTRHAQLLEQGNARDEIDAQLIWAADQFIVRRQISEGRESASILAGYHWFADWGRDTFISLPGLLLTTGRYEEAREVLETFGTVVSEGMIPNRFDDYGGEPHYNSVDASLWFINAAYQYLLAANDRHTFNDVLRPNILSILQRYESGTRFGIHADQDGLIAAGDEQTQLTWMDARCQGVSFTPRHGKAVEVNALWHNALCIAAETAQDEAERQTYLDKAEQVRQAFLLAFWNNEWGHLNDCVFPDGFADASLRPNQIFAVSLPFSPLEPQRQRQVVDAVRRDLYTPYGLRSLSPHDAKYRSHYQGDQFQRDSAYHQGTVWGFLMGPFIEAFVKVNPGNDHIRAEALDMLRPLIEHLQHDACLGNVSEIFDGDSPHDPHGTVAQAWSVAELLRVRRMLME